MSTSVRLGIVSDSHGRVESTRAAANLLQSFDVSEVLHCGDIGTPDVVRALSRWPTHYVFGNCDHELAALRSAIEAAKGICHERFGSLQVEGRSVAFLHGDDTQLMVETMSSGEYDLVCHGHTHVAAQKQLDKTIVLNPGALFRARPLSIAVVEFPSIEITPIEL